MEDSIIQYVEKNYRLDYIRTLGDEWFLFSSKDGSGDVLFYWNGENLWGPWLCREQRPTSFDPKGAS